MQTRVKITQDYLIHQHFAHETVSRLALLRHAPQAMALVGADGDISRQQLAALYPQARLIEYDHRRSHLQDAAAQRHTSWLRPFKKNTITQVQQSLTQPLPPAQVDLLWSNLALLWAEHVDKMVVVLENWSQALKKNGLLFFSHFGAETLPEIQAILSANGIACAASTWVDMHDLGDMLFHHGFDDPVIDTAKLVLTYTRPARFWQDMAITGLWSSLQVSNDAAARAVIEQAWQDGSLKQITLETVFAHAVKTIRQPENEQVVRFYPRIR